MDSDEIDPALRKKVVAFLDAEASALDTATHRALDDARAQAAHARQQSWLVWGGASLALAAGLAVFVVLPHVRNPNPQAESLVAVLADADVILVSEQDAALADDLAFIAWLEENDDPS